MNDLQDKLKLIREVGEEIVTEPELEQLLTSKTHFIAYDGFEPSGRIHLAQGVLRAININKMIKTGAKFKMLVADWHAWANHKMDGDLEKIKLVGQYFIEVWRASGMELENVEFVWASDLVKEAGYWDTVMQIAVRNNLPRIIRTVQIMGREETDSLTASQIIYPLMQTADIFLLGANVTQLGMDQRKVNMLAREVAEDLGYQKPIVVSHHMLMGLLPPDDAHIIRAATPASEQNDGHVFIGLKDTPRNNAIDRTIRLKMSKSKPDSAIFMTDLKEDIDRKIGKAWCPEGIIEENPILEYCKYIVFEKSSEMRITRPAKYGGNMTFKSYPELESSFKNKELFPLDLKNALATYINEYLEPVRAHFTHDSAAQRLKEEVENFAVTR